MRWLVFFSLTLAGCGRYGLPDSALIAAARSGEVASIRSLAAGGADMNERGGINDWTALMHAVHKNRRASVEALLDAGADPNLTTASGVTALIMAAGYGRADIVTLLLARGADPRARSKSGVSALAAAVGGVPDIDRFTVGHCQTETVRAILARAPELRLSGGNALRVARLGGCSEVVRMVAAE